MFNSEKASRRPSISARADSWVNANVALVWSWRIVDCRYTWVTGLDQLPDELAMSPTAPPGRTYRHLNGTPLYAFGFGLSYVATRAFCRDLPGFAVMYGVPLCVCSCT
jgi:hypothetical protein